MYDVLCKMRFVFSVKRDHGMRRLTSCGAGSLPVRNSVPEGRERENGRFSDILRPERSIG